MALNLGTLSTIFTADTRGLDRGFRKADRAFDELDRKAKRLSGSLDPVNAKTRKAGDSMDLLGAIAGRVTKNFNRFLGKMRVVSFTIGSLIGLVIALADELAALGATAAGVFTNVQLEPVRERMQSISDTAQLAEDRLDTLSDRAADAGANFFTMGSQMGSAVAALNAAGTSFDTATTITGNLTEAIVTLGGGSDDAGSALEDLAEVARSGEVTMGDLREMVSFTNDPLQTLANTFGVSTERIKDFIDTEQNLGMDRIAQVAQQLEGMSQSTNTLTGVFNRTLDAAIDLFETFNQQGGVIEALKGQLEGLSDVLRSDLAEDAILRVAKNARVLITQTLPNLARSTMQNWDTILTVTKSAAGFLVGSAVGGIPGGIIGAIIGGMGKTSEVMGVVGNAAKTLAPVFEHILAPALNVALGAVNDIVEALDILGTKLGKAVARDMVGPASIEGQLEVAQGRLKDLRQERERLREAEEQGLPIANDPRTQMRLERLNEQIPELEKNIRSLQSARAFTREPPFEDFMKPGGFDMVSFLEQARREAESFSNVDMSAPFKEFMKPGGFDPNNLMPTGGPGLPPLNEQNPFRQFMQPGGFDVEGLMPQASLRVEALAQKIGTTIDEAQRAVNAADSVGDAFTSAFQDAIIEGEKLSDVLNQLGKDIASTILKQGVTQPLGNQISQGIGPLFARLFSGGGNTTAGGSSAQGFVGSGGGKFAEGGIATQPSIFGEAGPEAAVPLPDGRSIPVSMKGGGTQVNIINQGESEPEVERRQEGGMEVVDVIIPAVKAAWASGEFDSENRKRYGIKPTPTGRS